MITQSLRKTYENQLSMLCNQLGEPIPDFKTVNNRSLLFRINYYLLKNSCVPFSEQEIKETVRKIENQL